MLSDEEKISLNRMKLFARSSDLSVVTAKDMDIVVTLIEKQQKEIEELKEKNNELNEAIDEWINGERIAFNCVSKDKIKAKIEYYEKIDNPVGARILESLLEKE